MTTSAGALRKAGPGHAAAPFALYPKFGHESALFAVRCSGHKLVADRSLSWTWGPVSMDDSVTIPLQVKCTIKSRFSKKVLI